MRLIIAVPSAQIFVRRKKGVIEALGFDMAIAEDLVETGAVDFHRGGTS